jgi:hypothetical protein
MLVGRAHPVIASVAKQSRATFADGAAVEMWRWIASLRSQ